ncbi:hypothetical protein ACEWY4_002805 [Coilia grayii]|uniref:Kinetochore protein Spc24 n=1 Tax=Coilia grayii TaxID=363190 RepID=A0ABD1KPJ2_9TELE
MALQLQDLEDSLQAFVKMLSSSEVVAETQSVTCTTQQLFGYHTNSRKTITQCLNDLTLSEEEVGHTLLGLETSKSKMFEELDALECEIRKKQTQGMNLDSELEFLQRELKHLCESEQEVQALEQEVDEDTTEIIPSAIYQAQLYHKVTKMQLKMDDENPKILKGGQYGKDLATPINIDTSKYSPSEISDTLWSFVSTAWN